ncbi:hypothetical protein OG21DRAFT_1505607 [Imleria badia]|nr:hypothetical protein OG21DRAFT_1505607 [Imleria badia]
MSLPTLPNALPTDATSDSTTDQSVSFLDYIALFLDYFIALVVFHGTLTLGFALATHDDVWTLTGLFGVLLLPSTYFFISGMVSSVIETDGIEPSFVFVCHLQALALFGMCTLAEVYACINTAGGK